MFTNKKFGNSLFILFLQFFVLLTYQAWAEDFPPSNDQQILSEPADPNLDKELDNLISMDLENLMVYVASKREERVQDSPGIVTVITAEDIKKYGARDFAGLLDRLTNTMVLGQPGGFQANEPNFRGIDQPGSEAETVLPLLNGRPLRDAYTSARSMSIYRSFPLYAIERLEIIRGPGSVLYGSNAFAGVINIITKDPEEDFNNAVAVGYGNLDTSNTDLVVNYKKGEFSAMAAGNVFNTEGWQFSQVDGNKVSDSFNMEQFRYGVTGQAKYKDLTANIYLAHRDDTTTSTPTGKNFPDKEDSLDSRHFADLQYKSDWGDGWTGQLNFTYNAYTTIHLVFKFSLIRGTTFSKGPFIKSFLTI